MKDFDKRISITDDGSEDGLFQDCFCANEVVTIVPAFKNASFFEGCTETTWVQNYTYDIEEIVTAINTKKYSGGKLASQLYAGRRYTVSITSDWLQTMGLKGNCFMIKYGVLSRHLNKDKDHNITESEWRIIPFALQDPEIDVLRYSNKYRLLTNLKRGDKRLIVGVSVKRDKRNNYHNYIDTLFFR